MRFKFLKFKFHEKLLSSVSDSDRSMHNFHKRNRLVYIPWTEHLWNAELLFMSYHASGRAKTKYRKNRLTLLRWSIAVVWETWVRYQFSADDKGLHLNSRSTTHNRSILLTRAAYNNSYQNNDHGRHPQYARDGTVAHVETYASICHSIILIPTKERRAQTS